jgi:hypothetical protein
MKQSSQQVKDALGDLSNVLVVDDNQKPLGVLYKQEFTETYKDNLESSESLGNLISNIQQDRITKQPWDKNTGIKNFNLIAK